MCLDQRSTQMTQWLIKIVGLAAEQDEIAWLVRGCIAPGAPYDQARSGEFGGASRPNEEGHTPAGFKQSPTEVSPRLRRRRSQECACVNSQSHWTEAMLFSRLSSHLMVAGRSVNERMRPASRYKKEQ